MPRYKLTIAYDGTGFHGWQRQFVGGPGEEVAVGTGGGIGGGTGIRPVILPGEPLAEEESTGGMPVPPELVSESAPEPVPSRPELRTVQGVLEAAVRQIVREPVMIQGSSRTDAGVHARGQVAAFSTTGEGGGRGGWPAERGTEPLIKAINSRLPEDVLVVAAEVAAADFDPIRAASKSYTYTFHTGPQRPVFGRQYMFHVRLPVDADAMAAAAEHFIGQHDFAAFAAAGHGRLTTVRTIHTCSVRRVDDQRVVMEVSGNGFLWNMVRIIGGTILEVGTGRRRAEDIPRVIASADRRQAGPTLPPNGLCLEWVRYEEKQQSSKAQSSKQERQDQSG